MYWFQDVAREYTTKPILLSSLVGLPSITSTFGVNDQVAIFTANSNSLTPMANLIATSCGVSLSDNRYVIVGCQDVPGFDAVAKGEKVDVPKVTPGMIELAKKTISQNPSTSLPCTSDVPNVSAVYGRTSLVSVF